MSISRQQEEQMLCQNYIDGRTQYFTSRGNITSRDIFETEDKEIAEFFIGHYATISKCRELVLRGELNTLIGELSGYFEYSLDEDRYYRIVRNYKRNIEQYEHVVALLMKFDFETNHYDTKQDKFMWVLANKKVRSGLKLKHLYMVYRLLHNNMGLQPIKIQQFSKSLKTFIDKETLRIQQL